MTLDRFHQIGSLLQVEYEAKNWIEVEKLAKEYLDLAEEHRSDWNYGNAIHHANLVLGKIALEHKDLEKAKDYFLKAGKSKGSPQLGSFGPNMSLARDLLEIGEQEVVLEYLDLVKRFWNPLFAFLKIRKWKAMIKKGQVPDFKGNNLYYLTDPKRSV
ncbi:MAG: hypothetical protein KDC53_10685 [Saprospiraceae bacterium]|nr:hypothetical protein [Saprospiraceae bacterium]